MNQPQLRRNAKRAILLLAPAIVTVVLYAETLHHPFFWDDVPHYDWATGRTWLETWTQGIGLSYFRPLTFSIYKLVFAMIPAGNPVPAHLLMLGIHAVNGWLVGVLTTRLLSHGPEWLSKHTSFLELTPVDAAGFIASLFFVVYPFAVLPIAHFAALVHPLVSLFVLAASLAALEWLRTSKRIWFVAALACSGLAPFAHESGMMAGPVALTVAALDDWSKVWERGRRLVLLPVASATAMIIWLSVPRSAEGTSWVGGEGGLASAVFFLQGPSYPLQPLSRILIDGLSRLEWGATWSVVGVPWWFLGTVVVVSAIALLIAGMVLWKVGLVRILGIALAWAALMSLPNVVALPFSYVTVSQRLLYGGGAAAALLWSSACVAAVAGVKSRGIRYALLSGLVMVILVPSILYVNREVKLHSLALGPLDSLATAVRQEPDERYLVINPVSWVNHRQPWYALGHEGVPVSANYLTLGQLVRLNTGTSTRVRAVTFPPVKGSLVSHDYATINEDAPWDWATLVARAPAFGRVWLTTYEEASIDAHEVGWVKEVDAVAPPSYRASFQDSVYLVDASARIEEGVARVELDWRYLGTVGDATVFRHIYGNGGQLLGQSDGHPLGRALRFSDITTAMDVHDVRYIPIDGVGMGSEGALGVGLYLPDGTRVPVRLSDGRSPDDGVVRVPIE